MHLILNIWGSCAFHLVYGGIYTVGSLFKVLLKCSYYAVITTKHVAKMIIACIKEEVMITDLFVCLVLSLINSKSNQRNLMKFSGNVDNGPIADDDRPKSFDHKLLGGSL